jgi:L-ribulose-5-phosphate 3-epimerase
MSQCFYKEFSDGSMSFDKFIAFCKEQQVDGVELSEQHIVGVDAGEVREKLQVAGLDLPSYVIAADFVQPDREMMEEAIWQTIEKITKARDCGAKHIMLSPGTPKDGLSLEEARHLIAQGLETIARFGTTRGLTVSTENHGGLAYFRGKIEHMIEFCKKAPLLSLTFDSGNFMFVGEDPLEALDALYHRVVHVHLKDYVILVDDKCKEKDLTKNAVSLQSVPLGSGEVPTPDILSTLVNRNYRGYISLESGGTEVPEEGIRQGLQYLRRCLQNI